MPTSAKPFTLNIAPTEAAAGTISASVSPGAATILIDGTLAAAGIATIGAAQLITLVSNGNNSAITFTINGTDPDGAAQSEAIAGPNNETVTSLKFFKTVTSITRTGSITGTFSSGNAITSVSPTFWPDNNVNSPNLGIVIKLISGTTTCALNQCFENFLSYPADTLWFAHAALTNLSATTAGTLLFPVAGLRIRVSASSSAVIAATFIQAGI